MHLPVSLPEFTKGAIPGNPHHGALGFIILLRTRIRARVIFS